MSLYDTNLNFSFIPYLLPNQFLYSSLISAIATISNKSEYAFEWLREDQNNNNVSTLNFWNGGDLSKSKQSISEDSALDIIQNSDWIPGLDKFLNKKNNLSINSDDKNPLSNQSTANDKGKLEKHKMSTWKQKDTKNKVTTEKNTETSEAEEPTLSKGFGK